MDPHAAEWANRLLDNPPGAPVLELLLQGARLEVLRDCWIAITGADAGTAAPVWRAHHANTGEVIEFPRGRSGVWTYVAVAGGFAAPRWLGSASAYPRGGLGAIFRTGDELFRSISSDFQMPRGVTGRSVPVSERRDYNLPHALRIWRAPQWDDFDRVARAAFFSQEWRVTSQCDRVGYRLSGDALRWRVASIISESTLTGTVQIPADGQPIVTMRDGPTVGGYPKLGVIDAADFSWLAQCRPGTMVRFELHPDATR